MSEDKYELFGDETTQEILTVFSKLYELGVKNDRGKLTHLQQDVLAGVSLGLSYSKLQKNLEKKHIASIQAPLMGGVNNLLDAIVDTVWLYNNPQLLEWLDNNAHKRYSN